MKMIKRVLLIAMLFSGTANAQLYITSITGYSNGTAPMKIVNTVVIDDVMNVFNTKLFFGRGMNLGLGVGYEFNENIAVELDCNTQIFTRSIFENDWLKYYDYNKFYVSGINGKLTLENRSLQFAP